MLICKASVEHRGVEPLTSTMRMSRATNCANAPYSITGASAISVGATGLAVASACCLLRLTHSGRFLLRRIAHRANASFVPQLC